MHILFILALSLAAHAEKILVVGDSLTCGGFGKRLYENLSDDDRNQVTMICTPSSAASNWINGTNPKGFSCSIRTPSHPEKEACPNDGATPKLEDLLKKFSGAKVIMALGTNSLLGTADKSYKKISQLLEHNPCAWVGPPNLNVGDAQKYVDHMYRDNPAKKAKDHWAERVGKEQDRLDSFYSGLAKAVGPHCSLTDSRPSTESGIASHALDGIHRTDAQAEPWADDIAHRLHSFLSSRHVETIQDEGSGDGNY